MGCENCECARRVGELERAVRLLARLRDPLTPALPVKERAALREGLHRIAVGEPVGDGGFEVNLDVYVGPGTVGWQKLADDDSARVAHTDRDLALWGRPHMVLRLLRRVASKLAGVR